MMQNDVMHYPTSSLSRLKCETCPNPKSKHSFDRFCGNPIDASSFHNSKLNDLNDLISSIDRRFFAGS
jgi:hypothetical protein